VVSDSPKPKKSRVRRYRRLPHQSAPPFAGREQPKPGARLTYDMGEFNAMMGIHEATGRRWIKAGVVRALKIRGQFRIPASEVERLLQGKAR
jgi:excisionase family DNA binding protein